MTRHWLDPNPIEIPAEVLRAVQPTDTRPLAVRDTGHLGDASLPSHLANLIAGVLVRRGITTYDAARAFLDPDFYKPASPFDLPDMDKAVDRLRKATRGGERILVWGDFDVDGQTATALLASALKGSSGNVTYHVPHREREGHGVHLETLKGLLDGVRVLVTCDTGIAAHEAVAYATSRGVDVIVTDHHNLPPESVGLPNAFANINPKRLPETHPLYTLPGVGVAYKLIEGMLAVRDHYAAEQVAAPLLDLVAMGIVADVAQQTGDTRYLLQRGLNIMRQSERPGLRALYELADINAAMVSEEQIGFAIAPRLNALGRLADAASGVELLLAETVEQARVLATQVERLNAQRRSMSEQTFQAATAQVDRERSLLDAPVLVLASDSWAGGIVGVVANRLVEQYNRPVILFGGGEKGILKGSARSIGGIDITAAITAVANANPHLIRSYGGHTMAAGLSIASDRLNDFRRAINRAARDMGLVAAPPPALEIADYVHLNEVNLQMARAIERIAPFGVGNPPLVLAVRSVRVKSTGKIGRSGEHLGVTIEDEAGNTQRVLWWGGGNALAAGAALPEMRFDLAFVARSRDFRGVVDVQLEWIDARPAAGEISLVTQRLLEVLDFRAMNENDQAAELATWIAQGDLLVWSEGGVKLPPTPTPISPVPRSGLAPAGTLVVWTTPATRADFRAALTTVSPNRVVLVCHDPHLDSLDAFAKRLAGLVKFALEKRGGHARIEDLAGAMAHSTTTVRAGLAYLAARGVIEYWAEGDMVEFKAVSGTPVRDANIAHSERYLRALLEEAAAYRTYVSQSKARMVVR